jgi:hypothetical protein
MTLTAYGRAGEGQPLFSARIGVHAWLLLDPPSEPMHAVALALKAREMGGQVPGPTEVIQQWSLRLEEITEFLRKSQWRSRGGAERCVRAVTRASKRPHARLARAVDAKSRPHPVLRGFALQVH